jgi:hypothetical protein
MEIAPASVPYIRRNVKTLRTPKNTQNRQRREGSGKPNEDVKAMSGCSRSRQSPGLTIARTYLNYTFAHRRNSKPKVESGDSFSD